MKEFQLDPQGWWGFHSETLGLRSWQTDHVPLSEGFIHVTSIGFDNALLYTFIK